jgi:retinol dehydrogenase-12
MSPTVNVVSTFIAAIAVLPKLQETALKFSATTTLAFVGSMIHIFASDESLAAPEGQNILDALSKLSVDMDGRYPLSKVIEHLCFNRLSEIVSAKQSNATSRVVINIANLAWCKTSLGRNKTSGAGERFFEKWLPRTAEMGSKTLAHGAMAGEESNECHLSECKVKPQSAYIRSAQGKQMQMRLWNEVMARIEKASPAIAGFLR